jgi:phage terminase large subunit-like protein
MAVRSSGSLIQKTKSSEWNGLTDKQREANKLLGGDQRHTLLVGGASSGKTFTIVRRIMARGLRAPGSRHAILRFRWNAARATIWLDTLPTVARLCFPHAELIDHRQDSYVEVVGPAGPFEIWIGGLDEKERVDKILGQRHATIFLNEVSQIAYVSALTARTRLGQLVPLADGTGFLPIRGYYDLNPTGKRHWSNLEFIEHVDPTTRRPLEHPENFKHLFVPPGSNTRNLPQGTVEELSRLPPRQRKRFYDGEYSEDIEGALWTFESLDRARIRPEDVPATLRRVVVAIDPSGTSGDEEKRSDAVGIVVCGLDDNGRAYVLADRTCDLPPEGWGSVAVTAYHEFHADRIIGEANFGGDMVRAVLHSIDRNVPYRPVTASRGKAVRAEPISVLYGHTDSDGRWLDDRVRHAGNFYELEAELLDFSVAGYVGVRSPNRADALVWALTDLLVEPLPAEGHFEYMRQLAASLKPAPPEPPKPVYAPGSLEYEREQAAKETS